ncbi:MAG: hypothetical protein ACHQHN_17350 [Sphingobacteriales bacterium]
MITQEDRIKAIEESIETGERKSINYQHDFTPRPVKRIPLQYLLYNPHNGRIRSYTKSYETQFQELNPENENDKLIIEQYLYDSATAKNEKTLESLEKNGQQEVGIVTIDGLIIDGNRRAMLLNKLSAKQNITGYFNAVVLPNKLSDNEKEIVTLETRYQMGVDSKVDYNPIEKYIRCQELQNRHGFSVEDISKVMAEEKPRIEEWLKILDLMDDYLSFLGTPGYYTRLEKREGHFVDLNNYLKSYKKSQSSARWDFTNDDILELKNVYFSYIRLGIPVQRARIIGKPTSSNSFFCHRKIWEDFISDYNTTIKSFDEPSFDKIKLEEPTKSHEDIIRDIDTNWKKHVEGSMLEDLSYSEGVLKDLLELHAPIRILKRVINSLGQINSENLIHSNKNDIESLLNQIIKKVEALKNIIS